MKSFSLAPALLLLLLSSAASADDSLAERHSKPLPNRTPQDEPASARVPLGPKNRLGDEGEVESGNDNRLYIIVGSVVGVLVTALAVVAGKKMRKNDDDEEEGDESDDEGRNLGEDVDVGV